VIVILLRTFAIFSPAMGLLLLSHYGVEVTPERVWMLLVTGYLAGMHSDLVEVRQTTGVKA